MTMRSIYIGYDTRETETFAVCRHTLRLHAPDIPIHAICLDEMRAAGLYWRPTSRKPNNGHATSNLWDDISEAPMSTEFAISRFLTPVLAKSSFQTGWALFMDCDILARTDISELFGQLDSRYAVMCVQHEHKPNEATKMDGQLQTLYARKNWSSVAAYNLSHPSNRKLTAGLINTVPGRDLHRFCWLEDHEIGALAAEWNFLVGYSALENGGDPKLVHFTSGGPWLERYANVQYADEWFEARAAWLNEGIHTSAAPRNQLRIPLKASGLNGSANAAHL